MLREWLKVSAVVGVALIIGLAGGLLYGLIQNPVRYRNVFPEDLTYPYRLDYVRMIAADYAQGGDLDSSWQRVQRLGFTPAMVEEQAIQAILGRAPGAVAQAEFAVALGSRNERLLEAIASPPADVIPLPTASSASTTAPVAEPSATRAASVTVLPAFPQDTPATPTPSAGTQ